MSNPCRRLRGWWTEGRASGRRRQRDGARLPPVRVAPYAQTRHPPHLAADLQAVRCEEVTGDDHDGVEEGTGEAVSHGRGMVGPAARHPPALVVGGLAQLRGTPRDLPLQPVVWRKGRTSGYRRPVRGGALPRTPRARLVVRTPHPWHRGPAAVVAASPAAAAPQGWGCRRSIPRWRGLVARDGGDGQRLGSCRPPLCGIWGRLVGAEGVIWPVPSRTDVPVCVGTPQDAGADPRCPGRLIDATLLTTKG